MTAGTGVIKRIIQTIRDFRDDLSIPKAKEFVVIGDGARRYPILKVNLRIGNTKGSLRGMSEKEYREWCQAVPAFRDGSDLIENIQFCDALIKNGAEFWDLGR